MTVEPLYDRVLVKRAETEEKTAGGIFIPPTAQEHSLECEVVAVGPGLVTEHGTRVALTVLVGDHVFIGRYSGGEIKVGGEPLLFVREGDILGIIRRDAAVEKACCGACVDMSTPVG